MSNTAKPGPESKTTIELVHRVSERVAKGIPIRVAIQASAKIKFLETTSS